ncbi:MAG: HAMP domain-containing histidine kinase [Ruminococcus sp.]|nr:HAMP domain-containing histidine kinase [Ruminococcus sp.]
MKRKYKKTKRDTLPKLLLRSFCVAAALCTAFAWGFWEFERLNVMMQCYSQIEENVTRMQSNADQAEISNGSADPLTVLDSSLNLETWFDIMIRDEFAENGGPQIVPRYYEDNHAFAAVVDKNGDIVASNLQALQANLIFGKGDADNGMYNCPEDIGIPGVEQLYSDYRQLAEGETIDTWVEMELESAYVNREERTFIPHKGRMQLKRFKQTNGGLLEGPEDTVLKTKDIDITIDDDKYEYIEVERISGKDYPKYTLFNFHGEEKEEMESFLDSCKYYEGLGYSSGGSSDPHNGADFKERKMFDVYINKEHYCAFIEYIISYKTPEFMRFYLKYVTLFSLGILLLTALYCWRKNVVNKAKNAMEDYQRELTNHLAHDIKTPLTAIGGYTENIMEVELTEEEKKQYLGAILDNIRFTDSIINRTLFLNSLEGGAEIKPEKISVESMVREAVKKYEPMLEEKNITFSFEGDAQIKADRNSFETIIENLISNAVKYTAENGSIRAAADRKKLVITNTVNEKTDVKDLKKPFVRGERSRSNLGGSGLGLSIAERAAALNGFSLKLSCTDTEFRAEVRY